VGGCAGWGVEAVQTARTEDVIPCPIARREKRAERKNVEPRSLAPHIQSSTEA